MTDLNDWLTGLTCMGEKGRENGGNVINHQREKEGQDGIRRGRRDQLTLV